jgi:hypothetical protein
MLGLGLGASFGRQAPWTPGLLPGLTFDANPALLALADGATIVSLANAIGGPLVLDTTSTTVKPTLDRAHAVNGRPAILLSSTGPSELYTAGGPTPGSAALEMYAVVQLTTTSGANASFPNFLLAGTSPLSEAGGVASNVQLGARNGQWFLGSFDGANLNVVAGAIDTGRHILHVACDGSGGVVARVDGVVLNPTSALPLALSLAAGFGFRGWDDPSLGVGDGRVYRALGFLAQFANLTPPQRMQLDAYLSRTYTVTSANLALAIGTSLTAGVPTSANSYVPYLTAQPGMSAWSTWSDGVSGADSTFLLARIATDGALLRASGARQKNVAVVDTESINEQSNGISQATTLSNLAGIVGAFRAAGFRVVTKTSLPWLSTTPFPGYDQSKTDALNTAIRAGVPGIYGDALADAGNASVCPQMAVSGADYDGVNRQTAAQADPGHPLPGAAGPPATGAYALAGVTASAILTL